MTLPKKVKMHHVAKDTNKEVYFALLVLQISVILV
jgi:hypothetical protein